MNLIQLVYTNSVVPDSSDVVHLDERLTLLHFYTICFWGNTLPLSTAIRRIYSTVFLTAWLKSLCGVGIEACVFVCMCVICGEGIHNSPQECNINSISENS